MATSQITFSGGESPSVDELAGGMPIQQNVLTDAAGAIRLRPGLSALSFFPTTIPNASPVIGMSRWGQYLIYVTNDRKLWALHPLGGVTALSSATATTQLDGGLRPVFASTRTRVIVTGGGKPQKWEGSGLSARLGGSPPAATHVTTIAQRVILNAADPSGIIYWSELGDTGAETWNTGLNFREAETKQDPVIGIYENSNEIVCLGTETIQMLAPDPSVVFSNARTMEIGCGPALSYVGLDEKFLLLDNRDRIMVSEGRSFEAVSSPAVGQTIDDMQSTSDVWGFRYSVGNYDFGVFQFPTDGRTLALETGSAQWCEYRSVNSSGQQGIFAATSSYYWAEQNATVVGLSTGQIAKLDAAATTDLGSPVTATLTTSFESHGTTLNKKNIAIRLRFKRGISATTTTNVEYSYRDDLGDWGDPFLFTMNDPTDVQPVVAIRSTGVYRQRQHRIRYDGGVFAFSGIEEDYTVLNS
jgi:hypothetical protein